MPIYEYECDKCGHAFEREQAITEPPVKTCPACRSRRVTKLISRTAFVLKGGGWYADGYSDKKATSGDAEAKSEPASGGESKDAGASEPASSESKTAAAAKSESPPPSTPEKPAAKGSKKSKSSKRAGRAGKKNAA